MKKVLSYVYTICALAAFAWAVYEIIPVFPYINEISVMIPMAAFGLFYFLAYRAGKTEKATG